MADDRAQTGDLSVEDVTRLVSSGGAVPPGNPSQALPPVAAAPGGFSYTAPTASRGFSWSEEDAARYSINDILAGLTVRDKHWTPGFNARAAEAAGDAARLEGGDDTAAGVAGAMAGSTNTSNIVAIGALLQRLSTMSVAERTILQQKLHAAGYYGSMRAADIDWGDYDSATANAFGELLIDANRSDPGNERLWTEFLDERVQKRKSGDESTTDTRTSKTVQSISIEDAKGSFYEVFRDAVGRAPTDYELKSFVDKYNAKAAANPQVSTTVTDAMGNSTTTTAGGVNADAIAREEYQGNSDYADYQAVSYYMPALEQALDSIGEGSGGMGL